MTPTVPSPAQEATDAPTSELATQDPSQGDPRNMTDLKYTVLTKEHKPWYSHPFIENDENEPKNVTTYMCNGFFVNRKNWDPEKRLTLRGGFEPSRVYVLSHRTPDVLPHQVPQEKIVYVGPLTSRELSSQVRSAGVEAETSSNPSQEDGVDTSPEDTGEWLTRVVIEDVEGVKLREKLVDVDVREKEGELFPHNDLFFDEPTSVIQPSSGKGISGRTIKQCTKFISEGSGSKLTLIEAPMAKNFPHEPTVVFVFNALGPPQSVTGPPPQVDAEMTGLGSEPGSQLGSPGDPHQKGDPHHEGEPPSEGEGSET